MSALREAAQQALEVLRHTVGELSRVGNVSAIVPCVDSIKSLEAALAQQEQEPVAWTLTKTLDKRETTTTGYLWFSDPQNSAWTPVFTHPPRREWRGLTEEEIMGMTRTECVDMRWPSTALNIARAIEQALKEKNHG